MKHVNTEAAERNWRHQKIVFGRIGSVCKSHGHQWAGNEKHQINTKQIIIFSPHPWVTILLFPESDERSVLVV